MRSISEKRRRGIRFEKFFSNSITAKTGTRQRCASRDMVAKNIARTRMQFVDFGFVLMQGNATRRF